MVKPKTESRSATQAMYKAIGKSIFIDALFTLVYSLAMDSKDTQGFVDYPKIAKATMLAMGTSLVKYTIRGFATDYWKPTTKVEQESSQQWKLPIMLFGAIGNGLAYLLAGKSALVGAYNGIANEVENLFSPLKKLTGGNDFIKDATVQTLIESGDTMLSSNKTAGEALNANLPVGLLLAGAIQVYGWAQPKIDQLADSIANNMQTKPLSHRERVTAQQRTPRLLA